MKKLFTLLMTLVLVFSVSEVALADEAKMTVSETKITASRGDKVEIAVGLSDCREANTLGVSVDFDGDVLAKDIEAGFGWTIEEGELQGYDNAKNNGVWAVETAKDVNGEIFKLAFTVENDAPVNEKSEVDVTVIVKKDNEPIGTFSKKVTVEVVCDHSYGDWAKKDANNHVHECTICGDKETEAHKWDSGKVTKKPTATTKGTKEFTCALCKATKTESIPATGGSAGGGTTTPDDEGSTGGGTTKPDNGGSNQGGTTTPDNGGSNQGGTTTPDNGGSNQGGTTTPDNGGSNQGGTTTPDNGGSDKGESTKPGSSNKGESTKPDASVEEESTEPQEEEDTTVDADVPSTEEAETEPETETTGGSGNGATIVIVILVIAVIAVAGVYFLKKKK